jgi:acetylornithine deacetylase/succinyl-diaminopimelate desuccinylase
LYKKSAWWKTQTWMKSNQVTRSPVILPENRESTFQSSEDQIEPYLNIKEHIRRVDVSRLAADLIKIPSCVQTVGRENGVSAYIEKFLRTEGIDVELSEAEPGRFNVIGRIKGSGKGRSLMLCGHMDTVPPYDMLQPYSGRIEEGTLYGRGACDMKGGVAAMLAALTGIKRSGHRLAGDLVFAGVIDEEEMGKGVDALAERGPFVDAAVIGEPTDLKVAIGHKGLEWLKIDVFGKKVHGGRLELGVNAVAMASRLIERLYNEYVPKLNLRAHAVLGRPTINVGRITGGDQPSTVPDLCTIEIDRRRVPEESFEQVYSELEAIIADLNREDPRFRAAVKGYFPQGRLLPHDPFCTDQTDALVRCAIHSLQQCGLSDLTPTNFPAWSDAGILAGCTQAKCIVLGPGDLANAHTVNDSVRVADLEKAAQIYGSLALEYCGSHV